MKNAKGPVKPVAGFWWVVAALLALGVLCPPQARAQVPARFYWDTLSNANAVPLIGDSVSGNTNPFDPGHTVTPGANLDATLALAGYPHQGIREEGTGHVRRQCGHTLRPPVHLLQHTFVAADA
jgi:hypothetical protein